MAIMGRTSMSKLIREAATEVVEDEDDTRRVCVLWPMSGARLAGRIVKTSAGVITIERMLRG
jgi:hypothetical protein